MIRPLQWMLVALAAALIVGACGHDETSDAAPADAAEVATAALAEVATPEEARTELAAYFAAVEGAEAELASCVVDLLGSTGTDLVDLARTIGGEGTGAVPTLDPTQTEALATAFTECR